MAAGLAAVAAAVAIGIRDAQPSSPPAPPRRKSTFQQVVAECLIVAYPGLTAEDAGRLATGWPANFVAGPEGRP